MDKLYFLPITDKIEQQNFNQLYNFISTEKQKQIKRYHLNIDRKLSLYSEILLRVIACQTQNIKNTDIVINKAEHGKPYIEHFPVFHYNISHTRTAIVIAVSDFPIGVDIERINKAVYRITKRFFTANEQEYISEIDFTLDKRFYEIWTRKEAYIKYLGIGLSMPLNTFDVLSSDISAQMLSFEKDGYIISICGGQQGPHLKIIELCKTEIEDMAYSLLV